MRIGDSNFPNQQLQVQSTFGKFPESSKQKLLLPGEWYHVALTWDLANTTIAFYVNGQLQSISNVHGKSDLSGVFLFLRLSFANEYIIIVNNYWI